MVTEAQKRAHRKYIVSDKGKASRARYNATDTSKARVSRYRTSGKGKASLRRAHLKKMYGITQEDYNKMYVEQKGMCCTCGTWHNVLCVDHSHSTGVVRGLLCKACNRALGIVYDDTTILYKMIDYLNNNR